MFSLEEPPRPIVQAPMAGGPSTPALAAAVSDAGGLGFLAGGYLSAERLAEDVAATRARTSRPFGVNLFVPDPVAPDAAASLAAYARVLTPLADRLGVALPEVTHSDDGYPAKLEVLLDLAPALASFTFGCPAAEELTALRERGVTTMVTVTSAEEAVLARDRGADALCVQGTEAGGHRSTFDPFAEPNELTTDRLLAEVAARSKLPLVAAGGVTSADDVRRLRAGGAMAVQAGTLFLLADEAGTGAAHRRGLVDFRDRPTVVTRAYSGRAARGIRNAFVAAHDAAAPAVYPEVNGLTKPLRTAAADDPEVVNLWAGTGFASATARPAAEIVTLLAR